jgi:hypothetical protein
MTSGHDIEIVMGDTPAESVVKVDGVEVHCTHFSVSARVNGGPPDVRIVLVPRSLRVHLSGANVHEFEPHEAEPLDCTNL